MTVGEVRGIIDPILAHHEVYPVELVVRGERNSQVLEIFIDSEEGVTSDTCAKVSRDIATVLRKNNLVKGNYDLVVSSPGIDRPFKVPQQYKRNLGKKLLVTFHDQEGRRTIEGTLVNCSDHGISLTTESGVFRTLSFDEIVVAKVSLPW